MIDVSVNILYLGYIAMLFISGYFLVRHNYLYNKMWKGYDPYALLMVITLFTVIIGIFLLLLYVFTEVNWV